MHREMESKGSYSPIDKEPHLLQLPKCHQMAKVNNTKGLSYISRIRHVTTKEHTKHKWEKLLSKSFGSNIFRMCSKTMPKGPLPKRWIEWMKADLNMFKGKSKSASSWNSIKEFEQVKDESKG
jgi:hypothetical protein